MISDMGSISILERLVSFPTISSESNQDLIKYVTDLLNANGIEWRIDYNKEKTKANLFAHVGGTNVPGVALSGHTDVVPVAGQDWTADPFQVSQREGRLYGRGTADMKGFIACAISAIIQAKTKNIKTPLWLILSYDEEIGCIGVRSMIDIMHAERLHPVLCIVGEPTEMKPAIGHKGKTALVASCRGCSSHSALAPKAVNALHLACDLVNVIRNEQKIRVVSDTKDLNYSIPYTTLHVSSISGGVVANIVPAASEVRFEIRNIIDDDPCQIINNLNNNADKIVQNYQQVSSEADISIEVVNSYPGLDTHKDHDVVKFVQSLTRCNETIKVSFGTEGGLFSSRLNTPVVICGPGSMTQGHCPDEYISIEQIQQCDRMLDALIDRLISGF